MADSRFPTVPGETCDWCHAPAWWVNTGRDPQDTRATRAICLACAMGCAPEDAERVALEGHARVSAELDRMHAAYQPGRMAEGRRG